jgi:hypothetical protein
MKGNILINVTFVLFDINARDIGRAMFENMEQLNLFHPMRMI